MTTLGRRGVARLLPEAPYAHLFVATGQVEVERVGLLAEGDALRVTGVAALRITARRPSELLVWGMGREHGADGRSDADAKLPLLIRVSGRDRPRLTRDLLGLVAEAGAQLEDMEQLVVRERLTLDMLVRLDGASDALVRDILFWGFRNDMTIDFERVEAQFATSRRCVGTR